MKKVIHMLAVTGLLALGAGPASAEVVVNYVQSERFADLPTDARERTRVLNELTAHFVKLGAQLAPGQILRIDVDDIDLAGRRVPTNGTREVRTVSGATDWPRINLEFELESNGQIARSGKVELRDMGFMDRSNRYYDGDALRFEKPMITEWFHAMVAPRQHYASR